MKNFRKLVANSLNLLIGSVISKGLLLILTMVLARTMSKESLGIYGIIQSTISAASVISGFSLGIAATTFISKQRIGGLKSSTTGIYSILIRTSLCASMVFAFVAWTSKGLWEAKLFNHDLYISLAFVISLSVLFTGLASVNLGSLSGLQNYNAYKKSQIAYGVSSFILLGSAAAFGGLNYLLYALPISYLFSYIISYNFVRGQLDGIPADYKFFKALKNIISFSGPLTLSAMFTVPVTWIANVMLTSKEGGLEQMAVYTVCIQWGLIIHFISTAISQVKLVDNSKIFLDKESKAPKIRQGRYAVIILSSAVIMFMLSYLLSFLILPLYGRDFSEANLTFAIYLTASIVMAINSIMGTMFIAYEKLTKSLTVNVIWAVMFVFLSYLFLEYRGTALSLSLALLISYLLHSVVQIKYLSKL